MPKEVILGASVNSPSKMSLSIFPKINGTTIKKEKRAAFSRSIPSSTELLIVAPEREMPGRIAMAWATPMMMASHQPTSLSVGLARSAKNSSKPVMSSIPATSGIWRSNKVSMVSSSKSPTAAAGIIDRIILRLKRVASLSLKANKPAMISAISLRNTTIVLSAVAACSTTVISRLSSAALVSPKKNLANSKCPLLLTGRNSVSPCTMPRRAARNASTRLRSEDYFLKMA